MTDRKIGKRLHMTVIQSDKGLTREGGDIWQMHQHFQLRRKHLRGSNRPAGWFHGSVFDWTVDVRWLWTEAHDFFAPEITFRPKAMKTVIKIAKAFDAFDYCEGSPDALCLALKAFSVLYVDDNKDGCWDDYLLLRDYSENAMMTLARAAQ